MSSQAPPSAAHPAAGPALAMLQLADTPQGLRALDALVKEAPVEVHATGTIQCGHYLIAFGGQVEAAALSYERASEVAGAAVRDRVLLADAEPHMLPAFRDAKVAWPAPGDTLGVIQSASCPTLLAALDASLKGARVALVELRIGDGLGGKALATLWGEVYDVEAAIELARGVIDARAARGLGAHDAATTTIIPNADDDVRRAVSSGTRFFKEWRG